MALRKRISYQWQLFIPLVATLWIIIFGLAAVQFYSERQYREQQIREQLSLVNARVVAAYEENVDIVPFLGFVCKYYHDNPWYDLLRVSVYEDGRLLRCYGEPIALTDSEQDSEYGITRSPRGGAAMTEEDLNDEYYYYASAHSEDGRMVIYTILPFDNDIITATAPSMKFFWAFMALAVAATVLAFFSTRYFGRNISNLRNIAERASNDPNFIPNQDYPHDELGDITRQITFLYNERIEAMRRERAEHDVAMHAIEEKARAKRQLTNNINHELRTPIGVIKGYLDTILDNPDMDEQARTHFLVKAQEHVNRLVNLIADVSAITRLEEGGEMISTEELDFHDIAFTIANDFRESGVLGKMAFHYDVPLDCKVNGNYNLLSGMLINLAKNAGAYSKGTLCELVMTHEDDKFYHFEFRDNGVGVPEEFLPHLFDRFFRVDSGRSRKAGGTGLGLPIVQNTVIAHGGKIEVCNGALGGLCFKFSLPKYKGRRPKQS